MKDSVQRARRFAPKVESILINCIHAVFWYCMLQSFEHNICQFCTVHVLECTTYIKVYVDCMYEHRYGSFELMSIFKLTP